ncbi:MAG TPA: type I restriction endonuclease [Sphingobium sp.]|nr:type I restriction endonuclease [Sphingobium sp.]
MELAARLTALHERTQQHREILLTEEAAKNALIMPFLQTLGYDVFNPAEVVPEFTADIGTKKGEKVDYAICRDGKVSILVECKPSSAELSLNHAGQLFRYFSVTDARLAILTNGVVYQFYSDIDKPNKMDDNPFFVFSMDTIRKADIRILEQFTKAGFDIDKIVQEAGNLKLESQIKSVLEAEFAEPSEEFVKLIAGRVHNGRLTAAVKDNFQRLVAGSVSSIIRNSVNDRITSALAASTLPEPDNTANGSVQDEAIVTTPEEISGFHIVQAIASRMVDPKRIVMRDAKSYCAILLDDNNRKTLARLHFNGINTKYLGTFTDKEETRHTLDDLTQIYQHAAAIEARIKEFDATE